MSTPEAHARRPSVRRERAPRHPRGRSPRRRATRCSATTPTAGSRLEPQRRADLRLPGGRDRRHSRSSSLFPDAPPAPSSARCTNGRSRASGSTTSRPRSSARTACPSRSRSRSARSSTPTARVVGAVSIAQDVTEKRLAQATLAEVEAGCRGGEAQAHVGPLAVGRRHRRGAVERRAPPHPRRRPAGVRGHPRRPPRLRPPRRPRPGPRRDGERRGIRPAVRGRVPRSSAPTARSAGSTCGPSRRSARPASWSGLRGIGQDVTDRRSLPTDQVLHPLDQVLGASSTTGPSHPRRPPCPPSWPARAASARRASAGCLHEVVELLGLADGLERLDDVVEVLRCRPGRRGRSRRRTPGASPSASLPRRSQRLGLDLELHQRRRGRCAASARSARRCRSRGCRTPARR